MCVFVSGGSALSATFVTEGACSCGCFSRRVCLASEQWPSRKAFPPIDLKRTGTCGSGGRNDDGRIAAIQQTTLEGAAEV